MPSKGDFGGSGFAGATTPASGGNFSSAGSPVGVDGALGSGGLFGWRCCANTAVLNSTSRKSTREWITSDNLRRKRSCVLYASQEDFAPAIFRPDLGNRCVTDRFDERRLRGF